MIMLIDFNGGCPYVIGDIIYSIDSKFDPNKLYNGTSWERVKGKVIVGLDDTIPDFNKIGKTGGELMHTLISSEMPSHNHVFRGTAENSGAHTHTLYAKFPNEDNYYTPQGNFYGINGNPYVSKTTSVAGGHSHEVTGSMTNTGMGTAHNNLQPYLVKYMWERKS